jgi:tRNA(fMet)-specific endonuclease VapC
MAFLLDSNTVIYAFKNAGQVRNHMRQHEDLDFKLCTPVLWELLTGANKACDSSAQHARLALFQARFELLPFDLAAARHAAQVRAQLEAQGTPTGAADTMIAGVALAHGLILVTRNVREFERVPGLQIQNWFEA